MGAVGASGNGATADGVDPARFREAYRAIRADESLQFDLPAVPPPEPPPAWLKALLEAIEPWMFWTLLGLGVAVLSWLLWPRLRDWLAGLGKGVPPAPEPEGVAPAVARRLLADADEVAAAGDYSEAAHLLLLRSVDALERRRPDAVRPALTSRDLLNLPSLPARGREPFGVLVRAVERSLFGGRRLSQADWLQCRDAYRRFAGPEAWA